MADLCGYASRPLAFIFRYVRLRPISHAVILAAVLGAVACSVSTQYGVKFLVDVLSKHNSASVWIAFGLLGSLIAADNLLWRLASWIANFTFVSVTGDLRRDLFRHLTGADRPAKRPKITLPPWSVCHAVFHGTSTSGASGTS